jgi:hypothetical protein
MSFVVLPKLLPAQMSRGGYLVIVVVVRVSKFLAFLRAFDAIETSDEGLLFAGKAMIKERSAMGSRWMSKAAQTRSILPMAALPRVFCVRRVREWNDPALVFWLSRVGREVKKRGDWSSRHGQGDLPEEDQKGLESPADSM